MTMIEKDEEEEGIIFPPPEIKGKLNGLKESFASSSSSTTFYFWMETDWSIYSNEQNNDQINDPINGQIISSFY